MRVAFRVDASYELGSGHVIRCLTLANEIKSKGGTCIFICRSILGNLIDLIKSHGHIIRSFPSSEFELEGRVDSAVPFIPFFDWNYDANCTLEYLKEFDIDWLVVDHYKICNKWEARLRSHIFNLMVIDDLADRMHDCSLLLDQNLGRKSEDYYELCDDSTVLMIGTKYALLRPEFSKLRDYSLSRRSSGELKHLLISFGGGDSSDLCLEILTRIKHCNFPSKFKISIVVGFHAKGLKQLDYFANIMPCDVNIIATTQNMAELMAEADLAIGACGGSSWERCCLGLPSIVFILAENQSLGASFLHSINAVILLESLDCITTTLNNFFNDNDTSVLLKMSKDSSEVCSGAGVSLIFEQLQNLQLVARPAQEYDSQLLFEWVNDPLVRRNSYNSELISVDEHNIWYSKKLLDEDCFIYIIENCSVSIGQVRFEKNGLDSWQIDYSLSQNYRGKGLGIPLVVAALRLFIRNVGNANVIAKVKSTNIASKKVFEFLDFSVFETTSYSTSFQKFFTS